MDDDNQGLLGGLNKLLSNPQFSGMMAGLLGGGYQDNSLMSLLAALQQQNNNGQTTPASNNMSNGVASTLPSDKQGLLASLKQGAAGAYPDNPTLQKVAMTQAILESGLLGKPSRLASQYNNYFGIKAPGTAGSVNTGTTEYYGGAPTQINDNFGANRTPTDSFNQHRMLMNNRRYQSVLTASDPYQAFNALKQAGYATDPRYSQKLAQIYNNYVSPLF